MHFPDYLTFVGAAMLVMQFKESKAFNLGRNVSSFIVNLDSRHSHDGPIDKEERAQEPTTQESDNTHDRADVFSEVGDRLTEQDHDAKKIIDGPFFRQTVEQKGFSNVILSSQIDSFLATTQKPAVVQSPATDSSRKSIGRPLNAVLDDISSELIGDRVPFPVNQVADGRASNKDTQLNVVRSGHSNERDDEDDISFEVQSRPMKGGNQLSLERSPAVGLDATDFHNRRDDRFLIQPESEDWFLVKQYMDDDEFRNAAEELAGEYFWQPVKNARGFDSESAEESNESS